MAQASKQHALILYFSGTGNTWLAAKAIKARLGEKGVSSDLAAIEEIKGSVDVSAYSVIGVGYPVYVFSIPGYVYRFIKKLPPGEGRRAFVFSTMGGGTFGSEALAALLLRNRGYSVTAAKPFVAVDNDPVLTGSADPRDPATKAALDKMLRDVTHWADEILDGKSAIHGNSAGMKLAAAAAGLAFRKLVPFHASSMPFWFLKADERCTGCGLCERFCPRGNIKESLRNPRFGTRCIFCERCVNLCPKNAVHFLFSKTRPQYRAPGFHPPLLRNATS